MEYIGRARGKDEDLPIKVLTEEEYQDLAVEFNKTYGAQARMARDPRKNRGRPFVRFKTVRFEGIHAQPYEQDWVFDLESVSGTLDQIQKYENKPGWRIIDFGNLSLDENEKGVFTDAVHEHRRIFVHCMRAVDASHKEKVMLQGTARKLLEMEQAHSDEVALKDSVIKRLEEELARQRNGKTNKEKKDERAEANP